MIARLLPACLLTVCLLATPPAIGAEETAQLPRFASLRAETVNMRSGPGVRYPIEWVFSRKALPVQITAEFDTWRRIRTSDGTEGWVHQNMLTAKRSALIVGSVMHELRRSPEATADAVARVEPGVIGRLIECAPEWCRLEIAGERGWLRRSELWGVLPDEVFE